MPLLSKPAFGPGLALTFITVGALIDVWTGVYYLLAILPQGGPSSENQLFWVLGLFLTGLTFLVVGITLGPIGRAARQAELPPAGAMRTEGSIQRTAAAVRRPGY